MHFLRVRYPIDEQENDIIKYMIILCLFEIQISTDDLLTEYLECFCDDIVTSLINYYFGLTYDVLNEL